MNPGKFVEVLREGFEDFYNSPVIMVPAIFLWLGVSLLSAISERVNFGLGGSWKIIVWFVFSSAIFLVLLAYAFSGIIGMCRVSLKRKTNLGDFVANADKFFLRNFLVILIIVAVGAAVGQVAYYLAFFIGKSLNFGVNAARALYLLIYFAELVGAVIFFTFSNFCLVIYETKLIGAIKHSFSIVKKEYLATLVLSVLLFVIIFLLGWVPGIFGELIEYILIIPLVSSIFTRFVVESGR
ncbi:hypothetical protein HY450_03635 [Candidatus Pacearchaeota archaeon]|nr:hypothetical protein [Candidatus Pacearchaeota archaeon]